MSIEHLERQKMRGPKVTVLTAVYNGLPYLNKAIESVLSQSYSDFDYLIIDDCSTDGSVRCIESYADSRIRFVKNERNLGTSQTMNRALSLIKTPYIVRMDQDDISLPQRVAEQIAYLEDNPDIAVVCSWEHTIDSNGRLLCDWKRGINNYGEFLGYLMLGLCPIWHPSITFRKTAIDLIGGFNPSCPRAEDFDVTMRFALNRMNGSVLPRFHLLQRVHQQQQSMQYVDEMAKMSRKIHNEAIGLFLSSDPHHKLAAFLRLERNSVEDTINSQYLTYVKAKFEELLNNVIKKQELNPSEIESFKNIIFRRVGYGLLYANKISKLPYFLLMIAFYVTSPFQSTQIKRYLSKVRHIFRSFRYLLT